VSASCTDGIDWSIFPNLALATSDAVFEGVARAWIAGLRHKARHKVFPSEVKAYRQPGGGLVEGSHLPLCKN
jgi:hypothetical protein